MTMSTPSLRKTANRKKRLLELILSLLSSRQVWKLRNRYAQGRESIAELAQLSGCPPVLLYCVLTPIRSRTALKLKMLRIEIQVDRLRAEGKSLRTIARTLRLPEAVVAEHSDRRYANETYLARPWYHDRAPKPPDPNELLYDENTLPPTARLGWMDGALTDIPKENKGRCSTCGCLVFLPCLACRVRNDMAIRMIPKPEEHDDTQDHEEREPDLLFR